ncbi:MAG: nicotinate-nucleotide adenylyltransferase [Lachnospiraceae bacterium]|nr:nicotinate-nucleotide adenylyltransferase [Lachnospiraceae bacterium]MBQ4303927.1 nicotinate-nucleotide adenylyltransferase [Lachnospiraceae bacterium]
MEKRVRTGIMGGTFDPPHFGHLLIAEAARDALGLDSVILMPSGRSYFKDSQIRKVSDKYDRLEMTRIAAMTNPCFTVSDMEVLREGRTYTAETLQILTRDHPDTDYFFIVGADTVVSMRTWYHPEEIFSRCTILAAVREDSVKPEALTEEIRALERDFGARIRLLDVPNVGFSSTDIKNRLEEGRSVRYMLPEGVISYIRSKGLYV